MKQIEDIRLQVVDNGFKLCYTECAPQAAGRTYDNRTYSYKELVYTDAQAQEAITKMIELRGQMKGREGAANEVAEVKESY